MTRNQIFVVGVIVTVIVSLFVATVIYNGGGSATAQPAPVATVLGVTDLKIDVVYQVLRTRLERLPNGQIVRAWYFTGKDRSFRSQYTPELDGRGRRIMHVVTDDPTLPRGCMRLVQVSESDPSLEGFGFGNYNWTGIQVQVNPRVGLVRQRTIPNGGPVRQ